MYVVCAHPSLYFHLWNSWPYHIVFPVFMRCQVKIRLADQTQALGIPVPKPQWTLLWTNRASSVYHTQLHTSVTVSHLSPPHSFIRTHGVTWRLFTDDCAYYYNIGWLFESKGSWIVPTDYLYNYNPAIEKSRKEKNLCTLRWLLFAGTNVWYFCRLPPKT